MFLYVFDYRKPSGGLWLPAPLARFVARHWRYRDYESFRPEAIGL